MSKGWYVKVATQVVFEVDTNIGVLASCEREAGIKAQEIVSDNLDKVDYVTEITRQIPWDFEIAGAEWNRSGPPAIDFDTMQALSVEPDPDFDPEEDDEPWSACCGAMLLNYNNGMGICADCKEWSAPPEEEEEEDATVEEEDATKVRDLMEAAQCLNEAFHDLPNDHPLQMFRETHGIAEVRDRLNVLAVYCDMTYRVMADEQGYDACFDWDFVPQFLENCVEDDFSVKSQDAHVLSMFWRGGGL